jgi:uncharacterized protein (DUF1778 family)
VADSRSRSDRARRPASTAPAHVLADRTRFVLDEDRWAEFMDWLDRPPEADPRLKGLFTKPSVFE